MSIAVIGWRTQGIELAGISGSTGDIDIIVDFDQPIGIEFIDLADYIEDRLQRKVDLVSKNGIKEKYHRAIEKEIIYV